MKFFLTLTVLLSFTFLTSNCNFLENTVDYDEIVKIIESALKTDPSLRHDAFKRTAYLVDTYGTRLWGGDSLELAIKDLHSQMIAEGFENPRLEEVSNITHWVRGKEKLTLLSPRPFPTDIPLIGLGLSVGGDVTSEVLVLRSFDELEEKKEEVFGKIVVFNEPWVNYSYTVQYRGSGPSRVAKYGGLACIIASVASRSIESPHTGMLSYDENYPKIPAAAISVEDAHMLQRMHDRGQKIVLSLHMEAHYESRRTSYNVVGEIKGYKYPHEVVLMGGHIDTWDVGPQTGANDDTAGFMVCFEAVRVLLRLGLRPKRTIRFIAWSGEEMGRPERGAVQYVSRHEGEIDDHIIAFESDEGTTRIYGFGFSGGAKGLKVIQTISEKYLRAINASQIIENDGEMMDTAPLLARGVPAVRNEIADDETHDYYFAYHHSAGDTVDVLDADDMDGNVRAIASLFYIIADMDERFPRD